MASECRDSIGPVDLEGDPVGCELCLGDRQLFGRGGQCLGFEVEGLELDLGTGQLGFEAHHDLP